MYILVHNHTHHTHIHIYTYMHRLAIRVLFFSLTVISNTVMWTLYSKSLSLSTSSLQPTLLNSSSNFCFTAMCGWLVFNEHLSMMWWCGAGFIATGITLITYKTVMSDNNNNSNNSNNDTKKMIKEGKMNTYVCIQILNNINNIIFKINKLN